MKKMIVFSLGVILLLSGCYPDGPDDFEELDLVYSNYDASFDFTSQKTYAMPDKIVRITGEVAQGGEPEFIKEPAASQILETIASNMSALGWTRVAQGQEDDADMVLFPASWTNTYVYYWYDYWCWWYYYYCGWGGWYGGGNVSSYSTGTLVMTLVPNDTSIPEPAKVWGGAINGLLAYSYDQNRVNKAIKQAFDQSPYLNVK